MLRSRVTSGIDVNRLANAVSRPGIDPRVWVSYAVCTSEPVVETRSGQQDVFVDVLLLPSGQPETARVGASYAGSGFGFYAPLHKDDEVLVCAPSGDPDEGLVVTQRLWSPADPPPEAAATYPEDVTLVVEEGKALRLNVSGGGKVYIGGNDDTQPVVLGQALLDYFNTALTGLIAQLNSHTHLSASVGTPTGTASASTPPITFSGPTSSILSTKAEVAP